MGHLAHKQTLPTQSLVEIIFQQVPDVLSSVADATQAFFPFLTYNKDLVMDVLKKVTNLMQIHPKIFAYNNKFLCTVNQSSEEKIKKIH